MKIQIADNIRLLRKQRSLTQEDLAEALSVSVGAVHKWETGQSLPEIRLLVEMAELFETSVDALLGYGWETGGMGQAADRIKTLTKEKNSEEALRYAERALKKYPNSFEVAYQSAEAYFLTMDPKGMPRACELYRESLRLVSQNPYKHVSAETIENRMAHCYWYLGKTEEALAIFEKLNVTGEYDTRIGVLLSRDEKRYPEALPYLSNALDSCYGTLFNTCIGYANVYCAQDELEKIRDLLRVLHTLNRGLADESVVGVLDRGDVAVLVILATVSSGLGEQDSAREYLRQARQLARRFDGSPDYHLRGRKFYHGDPAAMSFDDMGDTAMEIIRRHIYDNEAGIPLIPLWEEIQNEE